MSWEINHFSMTEINFVTEPNKIFAKVRAFAVPRKGELVNIKRVDYEVEDVAWALDHFEDEKLRHLRAIVYLNEVSDGN